VVTLELQAERRTAKACWLKTYVIPLSHATNCVKIEVVLQQGWSES